MKVNHASEHIATEDDLHNLQKRFGVSRADIAHALNLPMPFDYDIVGNTLIPKTRKRIPLPRMIRFEQNTPLVIKVRRRKKPA